MNNVEQKISIIIVNFNGRRFLERLLNSIRTQTHTNIEVIFVDNSSTDDSINFIKQMDSTVKIILSQNLGYGHAANLGAKKASGDYLIFLNEDMYLPDDFVSKMISFRTQIQRADPKLFAISCTMVDFDKDPKLKPHLPGGNIDVFGFPLNGSQENFLLISGSPFLTKKSDFLKLGGFNENIFLYGEDVDICWRSKIFGFNNYINYNTNIFHFGGGATGNFGPKKVGLLLSSSIIPMMTNYSTIMLIIIFPIYFTYIVSIMFFLLIYKKFAIDYILEPVNCFSVIIKKMANIIDTRKFVQQNRIKNDVYMLRYISIIPAFIANSSIKKLSPNYIITN